MNMFSFTSIEGRVISLKPFPTVITLEGNNHICLFFSAAARTSILQVAGASIPRARHVHSKLDVRSKQLKKTNIRDI